MEMFIRSVKKHFKHGGYDTPQVQARTENVLSIHQHVMAVLLCMPAITEPPSDEMVAKWKEARVLEGSLDEIAKAIKKLLELRFSSYQLELDEEELQSAGVESSEFHAARATLGSVMRRLEGIAPQIHLKHVIEGSLYNFEG